MTMVYISVGVFVIFSVVGVIIVRQIQNILKKDGQSSPKWKNTFIAGIILSIIATPIIVLFGINKGSNNLTASSPSKRCHTLKDFIPKRAVSYQKTLGTMTSYIEVIPIKEDRWRVRGQGILPNGTKLIPQDHLFILKDNVISKYKISDGNNISFIENVFTSSDLSQGSITQEGNTSMFKKWVNEPCLEVEMDGAKFQGISIANESKDGDREQNRTSYIIIGLGIEQVGVSKTLEVVKNPSQWDVGTFEKVNYK